MAVKDFYTFVKDLRPFGNGTPVSYNYVASAFTGAADGEPVAGELMAYDATNLRIVRFKADGGAGVFAGISRDSAQGVKKLGNQPALTPLEFSVFTSGVHEMGGVSGDVYAHGQAVYMNATSTQNIQKTQGTVSGGGVFSQLGTVFLPDGSTRTGAVRVPILIDSFVKLST